MYLYLKIGYFVKLFFLITFLGLFTYTILTFYTFQTAYSNMSQLELNQDKIEIFSNPEVKQQDIRTDKFKNLKYVLLWTSYNNNTENIIGEGQTPFFENRCTYTNCFLTGDKYLLNEDYTKFDAVIFDVHQLQVWDVKNLPISRSLHQKYIFYGKVSSEDFPICSAYSNKYFNWTWSYKLDSDIVSPFIEVRDFDGNVVAPKLNVNWEPKMSVISEAVKEQLKQKKKAIAWINKKCQSRDNRMVFAKRLQIAFKQSSLDFDIYGCGKLVCSRKSCLETIKRDYYFYFSPEDSNMDDYVSAGVLTAYDQFAVPIVYGGANYSKFLPEASYINAGTTSIDKLVALVEYIIRNPNIYYNFHRWRNHYVISETEKFNGICEVCEYLNDLSKFGVVSIKSNFRRWWYTRPLFERCFPKSHDRPDVLSYVNNSRRTLH
ncbi:alpha-(1,3)-fucosyltransferase C-like [Vanessa cardui]|uniref:alpha-(1,3)-fucosyltransferase C-like n=1 Tax=Vanessa cardui TaxID=171605 RepID=UPI001F138C2E|nr:alpha-(1,3)-fucosyltransferase C-like [Vanessa cardui]